MTYDFRNPDPGFGTDTNRVKPVNGIPIHPLLITESPTAIQI